MFISIQIVTIIDVYKFHALINRNKEKTLQWNYNVTITMFSFKLLK